MIAFLLGLGLGLAAYYLISQYMKQPPSPPAAPASPPPSTSEEKA